MVMVIPSVRFFWLSLALLVITPCYRYAPHHSLFCDAFPTNRFNFGFLERSKQSSSSPSRILVVLHALKVNIRIVGRQQKGAGEKWIEEAYAIYEERLRPANVELTTTWHKHNDDLCQGVDGDVAKAHAVVLLDPKGKVYSSEEFANTMYHWLDRGGSRLCFVIGGAEGLPSHLKAYPQTSMISLSALTFTHQFARILLAEQIYRASEIRKGSAYHK